MDPFALGLLALFSGPRSVAAIITPRDGTAQAKAIRVIRTQPDEEVSFSNMRVVQGTNIFSIMRTDVAQPSAGDTLTIGDQVFELVGEAVRSADGLCWRIGAVEA